MLAPVAQDARAGTGGVVWDSAPVLVDFLLGGGGGGGLLPRGARVLELGAGTGVVGLSLLRARPDLRLRLTDKAEMVPLLEANAAETPAVVEELDWAALPARPPDPPVDVVVACDCSYEPGVRELLAAAVRWAAAGVAVVVAHSERVPGDVEHLRDVLPVPVRTASVQREDEETEWGEPQPVHVLVFEK